MGSLDDDLKELDELELHLFAHRYASAAITAQGPTIDPPEATADRAETLAMLAREDQKLLASPAADALLARLDERAQRGELSCVTQAQARALSRRRQELSGVPSEDQAALAALRTTADAAWRRAKRAGDWKSFEPWLQQMVDLMRQIALEAEPERDPYDVWLARSEPGCGQEFYDRFFAEVKATAIPLISAIAHAGRKIDDSFLHGHFEAARQWQLARDIAELEGVRPQAWWLTSTEHPFSQALTSHYAICAAHIHEEDVSRNLFTMLHEGGHNLYGQNTDPALDHTSLQGPCSAGMNEAQSRFFENYVGRDEAFAPSLVALLKKRFPEHFANLDPHRFWLAVNRVQPGAIRTTADELTYPLHIIIRYEIEQELFAGSVTAADVPRLWNERYERYLGIQIEDERDGALQDMHWANGLMGYFPTYALGGAYGAQFRHQMLEEGLPWEDILASGDLSPISGWLKEKVWRYGRMKDPADLLRDSCGPFDVHCYTSYLESKFTKIYQLG